MANQWPALVVTTGPQAGQYFAVQAAQACLGRGDDADFRLQSSNVSRRHATVVRAGEQLVITDLGSANGTFVNGTRLAGAAIVNPGDAIRVADVELQFALLGSTAPPPSQPSYDLKDVSGNVSIGGGHQNTGSGHQNVGGYQNIGSGSQYVAGGSIHHGDRYELDLELDDPMQEMFAGKGFGRVLMVLGLIVLLVGFGIWMSVIFSGFTGNQGGFNEDGTLRELENPFEKQYLGVNAAVLGFSMFGGGGFMLALGFGMSKAARKRAERSQR